MANSNKLIIIDGNSLINRAYYALQRPMITKDGVYTHGVYGFINMLSKIERDYKPSHMVVTFDLKAPTFRHKTYDQYKANRKGMPPELAMQMPLLKEVLDAMNIHRMEMEGYEGDDIIGTVAVRGEKQGLEPIIITGDKDALQLATDITKVLITKKGISEFEMFDASHMIEVYGLTPLQFIDYKGLRGDTSDNIPGIAGIGEKTALKLLSEFGSIENLIKNTANISQAKLRQKVEENAEMAILSKKLATIDTNVPIDFDFKDLECVEPDYEELIKIYIKLEFNSFLKKIKKDNLDMTAAKKDDGAENFDFKDDEALKEDESKDEIKYENVEYKPVICDGNGLEYFNKALEEDEQICITAFSDENHKDRPEILGFAFTCGDKVCFVKDTDLTDIEAMALRLSEKQIAIIGHNLKADYYALLSVFDFKRDGNIFNTYFDTSVAEYLINPTGKEQELKTLSLSYTSVDLMSQKEVDGLTAQMDMFSNPAVHYSKYAAEYLSAVMNVYMRQKRKLEQLELVEIAETIEFPLIEVMASMEKEGFCMEPDVLTEIGNGIKERINELTKKIYELAGEEFNINSPQQLGNILFEKLGLPTGKKTKTGYSTSAEILEKLKKDFPIVALVLEYRTISKLNSTYIEGLIPLRAKDLRIHAHFQQTVTATGRISCTEPNLQNIPIRQELGRKIRKAFVPRDEEHILIGADYSQIELRVLAHLSGEEHLINAFNAGEDIHRRTASKVFGVPFEDVTPTLRSNAKAVNFGVIYGMSGFGLASELNISIKSAEAYIKDYFEKYSKVKEYMDEQISFGKKYGYSKTMLGRRRPIPEINASNYMVRQFGERLAMNTPIQGTAADIIKLAMIKTYIELRKQGLHTKLILQVHDELILDTPLEELEQAKELLLDCMENVIKLKVKLVCEENAGKNWYELK